MAMRKDVRTRGMTAHSNGFRTYFKIQNDLGKVFNMMLSMHKTVSSRQRHTRLTKQIALPKMVLVTSAIIGMLSLSACQTVPTTTTATSTQASSTAVTTTAAVTQTPAVDNNDYEVDYPIEPYIPPEQSAEPNPLTEQTPVLAPPITIPSTVVTAPSRNDYIIAPPPVVQPTPPSHNELLERARQNSKQQSRQATTNNSNLPAFQNLMQSGIGQLKAGNLTAAESSFTRAQRLAPKSSAVYFYLAQVALKKDQPRKAEAMARRGLSVSQETSRRRTLWQLILRSGQLQNNPRVIREAQQALR